MREHDRRIIHSSEESNWRTPSACFEALHREFHFTLDAAADSTNHLTKYWFGPGGIEPDALEATEWARYAGGAIFLNPPYSKSQKQPIEPWVHKCYTESMDGATVVAILPFAPQTVWYRAYVYGLTPRLADPPGGHVFTHAAMEERRLSHRISFLRPDGSPASNAGVNSVVVIWKPNPGYIGVWQPAVRYWSYR